tara:strand:- start:900 stop:1724 length:825 start_codon:yes stop_codon:yes gene_type:complete
MMAKYDPWMNLPLPAAPIDEDDLDDEYDEMRDYDAPPKADGAARQYYDYEYNPSDKYETEYYKNLVEMEKMDQKSLIIMLKKDIDDLKLQIKDSCKGSYVIPPSSISVGGSGYESVGGENSARAQQIKKDRQEVTQSTSNNAWLQFANRIAHMDPPIFIPEVPGATLPARNLADHYLKGKPLLDSSGKSVNLKLPRDMKPPTVPYSGALMTDNRAQYDRIFRGGKEGGGTPVEKGKWATPDTSATDKYRQKRRTRRTRRRSTRSRRSRRRVRKH